MLGLSRQALLKCLTAACIAAAPVLTLAQAPAKAAPAKAPAAPAINTSTCTTCHANPETDNQHGGVGGYVYESNACLACHPTGNEDDVFDHNNTGFPLTGAHTATACVECHKVRENARLIFEERKTCHGRPASRPILASGGGHEGRGFQRSTPFRPPKRPS